MTSKLKGYTSDPDPEVWNRIQNTLHVRTVRRQAWTAAAGAAIVALAIVGVVFWPSATTTETSKPIVPEVAQLSPKQIAVQPEEPQAETKENVAQPIRAKVSQPVQPIVDNPANTTASAIQNGITAETSPVATSKEVPVSVTTVSASTPAPVTVPSENIPQKTELASVYEQQDEVTSPSKASGITYPEDTILWIPNAFAPASGDDAINRFRPRLNHPSDVVNNFKMVIFNRSGHQVFMCNDINEAWDGTYRGREMPQAAYVYLIYYTDKDGLRHQRKGTITLIR